MWSAATSPASSRRAGCRSAWSSGIRNGRPICPRPRLPSRATRIRNHSPRALEPGDRVFMVSMHQAYDRRLELHRAFIDEAVRRRVGHVVYLSFIGAGANASFSHARSHGATETMLRDSGLSWSAVRNGMYGDEIASWFDPDGRITGSGGEGRISFSYRPELGQAIAVLLADEAYDDRDRVTITTPDAVSLRELAALATDLTGDDYRYEPLDPRGLDRVPALGRTPGVVDRGGDLVLRRRLAWRGGCRQPRLRGAHRYACPHRARAARAVPRRSAPEPSCGAMTRAVILSAVRTPIGRYGGGLAAVRPDDLAAIADCRGGRPRGRARGADRGRLARLRQPGGRGQPERGALRCAARRSARFRRRRHRQPPLRLGPRGSRRRLPRRRRRGRRSLRCGGCRVDDPRAARDAEAGCAVRARRPRASRHDARLAVRQPALRGAVLARGDGGDGRERRRSLRRLA